MNLKAEFLEDQKAKTEEIETILKEFLPREEGYQKIIMEAMGYSLLAGGKRLRPMLMKEVYLLFSEGTENLEEKKALHAFMAAQEMIHTYSLVHDDLPAMDNDEYRRGKKTTHIVYGEDIAILTGDALLNFAFETAQKSFSFCETLEEYKQVAEAMKILAKKAGIYGMLGGQVVDVEASGKEIPLSYIEFIYQLKTSALLEAALLIGAILAGADEERQEKLEKAGTLIGFAFQIKDDILDISSTSEELGKPIHSDEKNQKTTYVTLKGLEQAEAVVKELSEQAILIMEEMGFKDSFLCMLFQSLIDRRK